MIGSMDISFAQTLLGNSSLCRVRHAFLPIDANDNKKKCF
jgi:hypothetical protein